MGHGQYKRELLIYQGRALEFKEVKRYGIGRYKKLKYCTWEQNKIVVVVAWWGE